MDSNNQPTSNQPEAIDSSAQIPQNIPRGANFQQSPTTASHEGEDTPPNMGLIKSITKACTILGFIIIAGAALIALGLSSGFLLSNQGLAMASSLLVGVFYYYICGSGTILCLASIIMILYDKWRYHISIKKLLALSIGDLAMINVPSIILFFLLWTA